MKYFSLSVLATAACVVCFPAHAQSSSVTLYGIADAALVHISNQAGQSYSGLQSGRLQTSRIGFRGVEDLGGGLSAIFAMESGLDLGTGSASSPALFFNRQTWMGLRSQSLGTLTFGRQYAPIYDLMVLFSGAPSFGLVGGAVDGVARAGSSVGRFDNYLGGTRVDSSIKYTSPTWGGFKFNALASLAGGSENRTLSVGAAYKREALDMAVTYLSRNCKSSGGCLATEDKDTVFAAMLGYNFGFMHVGSIYSQERNAKNVRNADADVLSVRLDFPVNAWNFKVGYQMLNDKTSAEHDVRQLNLGATYTFSKRTLAYAFHTSQRVSNQGIASMGLVNSSNDRQRHISVGVRHAF